MISATSGACCAIQSRAGWYPSNSGFQYASWVLPRSMAAPIEGTCEVASPQITSAIAAAARCHHGHELLLGHARERAAEELHRPFVHQGQLEDVEDVAAEIEHAHPVAVQHGLLLLRGQVIGVAVRGLVTAEGGPALRGAHGHAQIVEVVPTAALLSVEYVGSRHVDGCP